jgi:hypothetical protein
LPLLQSNRMIFSCAVSFESKKKNIPDLSLPPCNYRIRHLVIWISIFLIADPDPDPVPDPGF